MHKKSIRKFFLDLVAHPILPVFSLIFGLCAAALIYVYHFQLPLFSLRRVALCLVIALVVAVLAAFFLYRITLPIYFSKDRKLRIGLLAVVLALSLFLTFTLTYTIPHIYPFYPTHTLRIDLNLEDLPAGSDGVSFSHMQLAYRDVSFSELKITGQYEKRADSIYFPAGQTASIAWQGITGEQASIYFQSTPFPYTVKIRWDDQVDILDLSASADIVTASHAFPAIPGEELIVRLLTLPVIALLLFVLVSGLFSPHPYAYILLIIWLFVYLLFWPGIIGDVSIIAVDELWQGHPTDWHPITFTLLLSFCMRYLASASSLLLVQIAGLALLVGNAFSFLNRKGVSNKVLIPLSCLLAVLPTNFLSIITLTNDIPYSIVLMGLTFLAFKIVITHGKWLESRLNLVLLAGTASLAILFRYNGIPAVACFLFFLLVMYSKFWRRSLLILVSVVAVWLLVSGPVYSLLHVTHDSQGQFDNILLHHISAHIANGTPMTDEEKAYLNNLLPLDEWNYSCCTNSAMWANSNFDRDAFHANSSFNRQLELSLIKRNPGLEVSHMLCASDIVWNVYDGCEIKHPFVEETKGKYYWTRSYLPEYAEASFFPKLIAPISRLLIWQDENPLASALLWHPAWYLYIAILCAGIIVYRFKSWRGALVLTPALGQSLFLLLFNRVQNFRYQYCVVLVGFLLIAAAFYQPESKD